MNDSNPSPPVASAIATGFAPPPLVLNEDRGVSVMTASMRDVEAALQRGHVFKAIFYRPRIYVERTDVPRGSGPPASPYANEYRAEHRTGLPEMSYMEQDSVFRHDSKVNAHADPAVLSLFSTRIGYEPVFVLSQSASEAVVDLTSRIVALEKEAAQASAIADVAKKDAAEAKKAQAKAEEALSAAQKALATSNTYADGQRGRVNDLARQVRELEKDRSLVLAKVGQFAYDAMLDKRIERLPDKPLGRAARRKRVRSWTST